MTIKLPATVRFFGTRVLPVESSCSWKPLLANAETLVAPEGLLRLACTRAKLLLIVLNAVRNGSPLPAPGPDPMLTLLNVIAILDL